MSRKATECKVCGAPPERGAYCLPCLRKRDLLQRRGDNYEYKPRIEFVPGMPCPACEKPIEKKHPNYTLCHSCGKKKSREKLEEWRKRSTPLPRPANNPIIVSPVTHRAKGQAMAPPAPKAPPAIECEIPADLIERAQRNRIQLKISRWEHGGDDLWTPRP